MLYARAAATDGAIAKGPAPGEWQSEDHKADGVQMANSFNYQQIDND
jgi:hypothetical protein